MRFARLQIAGFVAVIIVLGLVLMAQAVARSITEAATEGAWPNALAGSRDEGVACHRQSMPGIVEQYGVSAMALPYRKTQAYFLIISMGSVAMVISSVLDHARDGFANPWLWLPTGAGVFATVIAGTIGAIE